MSTPNAYGRLRVLSREAFEVASHPVLQVQPFSLVVFEGDIGCIRLPNSVSKYITQ
jgi:hypothetical protein